MAETAKSRAEKAQIAKDQLDDLLKTQPEKFPHCYSCQHPVCRDISVRPRVWDLTDEEQQKAVITHILTRHPGTVEETLQKEVQSWFHPTHDNLGTGGFAKNKHLAIYNCPGNDCSRTEMTQKTLAWHLCVEHNYGPLVFGWCRAEPAFLLALETLAADTNAGRPDCMDPDIPGCSQIYDIFDKPLDEALKAFYTEGDNLWVIQNHLTIRWWGEGDYHDYLSCFARSQFYPF